MTLFNDLKLDKFLPDKLFFLTIKNPKWQRMDKVRKHVAKVSKVFIIVREPNVIADGHHYHILFRSKQTPRKNWFRKGVHMNLREYGKFGSLTRNELKRSSAPTAEIHFSRALINSIPDPELAATLMSEYKQNRILREIKALDDRSAKLKQVLVCLKYMSKTFTSGLAERYVDYYIHI